MRALVKRGAVGEFPGGPVAGTGRFHGWGPGFKPWWVTVDTDQVEAAGRTPLRTGDWPRGTPEAVPRSGALGLRREGGPTPGLEFSGLQNRKQQISAVLFFNFLQCLLLQEHKWRAYVFNYFIWTWRAAFSVRYVEIWKSLVAQWWSILLQYRRHGFNPGSGRPPGEGNGNPCQYPCLENPMDGRAWRAMVLRVTESWTRLRDWTTNPHQVKIWSESSTPPRDALSRLHCWWLNTTEGLATEFLTWKSLLCGPTLFLRREERRVGECHPVSHVELKGST